MKIIRKIICLVCFIFYGVLLFGQGSITIYRESYLETNAACPKTEYQYWVDTKPNYGNYEWKITGGSFKHFGQNVKEINLPNISSVIVVWDNVVSSGGNAPKGTITLNVYDKNQTSKVVGNDKREQEIKSLKDMIPPSLSSSVSPPLLNFSEQEVRVYLIGPFNFPGIKKNGFPVPVTQYEWQIPAGWTAKTGNATSSGTYITPSAEIKLITDAASGGQVKVRGVNDCAGSGDYSEYSSITFTRKAGIEFLEYPQTVPLGEVATYKFSVLSMTGVSFEWEAPTGWSINGGGNTYTGGNVVQITTSECPTNQKVRVRLVQGDIISTSAEFPTTVALPAIKPPTEEIKQYESVTFSLDIPDDNIGSVEWLVNGNSVGEATNTSSLSFRINESGKVNISAKLTLEGCSAISIPEIEVDVVKAPDPVISGPSSVCDQATYTINNLPEVATVQWSVSNDNLILVSSEGDTATFRKNGNGESIIQCNITIGTSSITLQYSVWAGVPPVPIDIFGPSKLALNSQYSFTVTTGNSSPGDYFEWTVGGRIAGAEIISGQGTGDISIVTGNRGGPLAISVKVGNSCGWSSSYSKSVMVDEGLGWLSLYPNPATDMVTVKLEEEQPVKAGLSTQRATQPFNTGPYEIELWSASAMLRRYTTDQPIYQIPVSGLPAGIYFVRVIKDGQTHTKKLIKK